MGSKEWAVSSDLRRLVGFLNADPKWEYVSGHLMSKRGERQLRNDIVNDITPLIETPLGSSKPNRSTALHALLKTVNDMRLRPLWYADFDKPLLGYSRDGMLVAMRRDQAPPYRDLGPNLKIIKFSDTEKWIIRMDFDTGKPREYLYGTIVTSLQNGEFMELGRCPECHRFFIGERRGQKYCNPKCTKAGDKRAAPARMEEHRKRIEEKIKSSGLPKLARLATQIRKSEYRSVDVLIDQMPELLKLKRQMGRPWVDFIGVVTQIKRRGDSTETIWDGLPPRLKKALAEVSV